MAGSHHHPAGSLIPGGRTLAAEVVAHCQAFLAGWVAADLAARQAPLSPVQLGALTAAAMAELGRLGIVPPAAAPGQQDAGRARN